jgi:hypothetical protein
LSSLDDTFAFVPAIKPDWTFASWRMSDEPSLEYDKSAVAPKTAIGAFSQVKVN